MKISFSFPVLFRVLSLGLFLSFLGVSCGSSGGDGGGTSTMTTTVTITATTSTTATMTTTATATVTSTATSGSCNPLAFAMLNTANSNAKVCASTMACIDAKCAEGAVECAGPDYKVQNYAGTCGAYLECVKTCKCAKACVDKCDPGTTECASCLSITFAMGCTMKCVTEIASCGKQ